MPAGFTCISAAEDLRGGDAGKPENGALRAGHRRARSRLEPLAGVLPADAPVSSARGGASGRIFLDAAREIAGILEELVQREAERDSRRPRRSKAGASGLRAATPRFPTSQTLSAAERLKRRRSAPAGEFIRAPSELASLAAETRKPRGKTLSNRNREAARRPRG